MYLIFCMCLQQICHLSFLPPEWAYAESRDLPVDGRKRSIKILQGNVLLLFSVQEITSSLERRACFSTTVRSSTGSLMSIQGCQGRFSAPWMSVRGALCIEFFSRSRIVLQTLEIHINIWLWGAYQKQNNFQRHMQKALISTYMKNSCCRFLSKENKRHNFSKTCTVFSTLGLVFYLIA